MDGMNELTKLAMNYGLGIVLSMANVAVLFFIIRWVLKTSHERETTLAEIIKNSIVNNTEQTKALVAQVASMSGEQILMTEYLKSLDGIVKERWREMKTANDFQREEHKDLKFELKELKGAIQCRANKPYPV